MRAHALLCTFGRSRMRSGQCHSCLNRIRRLSWRLAGTAHGRRMDEYFWTPFAELTLRDDESLTDDERASLNSFLAADAELLGAAPNSAARRWARMARVVGRQARELGRLPVASDPWSTPEHLEWIASQKRDQLNSYQRACLMAMPGWCWPTD